MIEQIQRLPRKLVVADFGCGEAQIAATCVAAPVFDRSVIANLHIFVFSVPNKVHSFDLVAANPRVTACDVSRVPLGGATVDIAVFCLSLMGTNFHAFLQEAHRVLRLGARLYIAEVKSRIPDLQEFIRMVETVGFAFVAQVVLHRVGTLCSWR